MRRSALLAAALALACSSSGGGTTGSATDPTDPTGTGTTADTVVTGTGSVPTTSSEPTTSTTEPVPTGTTADPTTGPTTSDTTTNVTEGTASTDTTDTDTTDTDTTDTGGPPCQPGDQQSCFSGLPDHEGQGNCAPGLSTCDDRGVWGPCVGEVLPAPESCETPGDEDCDGLDPCGDEGLYQWHKTFGAGGDDSGVRVAFDGSGALIVAARSTGTLDFGGGPLVSAGSNDLFLAKFAPDGAHLWSERFGDSSHQFNEGFALAASPEGEIVVAGDFAGKIDLGGDVLTASGVRDIFMAKFGPDGAHLWSRGFVAGHSAYPHDLELASDGAIVLVGDFNDSINFGGGDMQSAGSNDPFVARFTAAGDHAWSLRFGDGNDQAAYAVAVDASGHAHVAGRFTGTIDPGDGPLVSAGNYDAFLVKYSPIGNAVWSQRLGGSGYDAMYGLAVDASGRVTGVGHSLNTALDLGGDPLMHAVSVNFAVQVDDAGAHQWSRVLATGNGAVRPVAIAANPLGPLFITGNFTGSADFGGGALAPGGGTDIFVVGLAPSGAPLWSKHFGDFADQAGLGVAVAPSGLVAITGEFQGGVNFGGGPNTSQGQPDGFVAVFAP